jgi:hypothetical protein
MLHHSQRDSQTQNDASYSHSDLTLFDQQTGEDRSHVNHIVGAFWVFGVCSRVVLD